MSSPTNTLGTAITVGKHPLRHRDHARSSHRLRRQLPVPGLTPSRRSRSRPTPPGPTIAVGTGPDAIAITPDEAPAGLVHNRPRTIRHAELVRRVRTPASPTATITKYHWDFGDGTTLNTASAPTAHTYATPGVYTVTLTETDTAGTSTTQTFTGQTISRNGGPGAQATQQVTISAAPQIVTQPTAATATAPNAATFTISCSGSPSPTFQWQISTDGGTTWGNLAGQTASTLTLTPTALPQNASQYRAICINTAGSATSNAATLTVITIPQVTTQPVSVSATAPDAATFTVACSGSPAPTLQWQLSSNAGQAWTNLAGQTAPTLTLAPTSPSLSANEYRAVCANLAGSATSNQGTLTITSPSSGATGATGPTGETLTPPVLGVDFQAQPHGHVFARLTPGGPLVALTGPVDLPVGSLVDARSGTLTLAMAMPGQPHPNRSRRARTLHRHPAASPTRPHPTHPRRR